NFNFLISVHGFHRVLHLTTQAEIGIPSCASMLTTLLPGSPLSAVTGNERQVRFKTTIAIDPGATGGVAFQRQGQPAEAMAMPSTEGDLVALSASARHSPDRRCAADSGVRPKDTRKNKDRTSL